MGTAIQVFVPFFLPYFSARKYQPPYFLPRYSVTSLTSTSLSVYRCGSSGQPTTMSGPAPVLAATAVCGRRSSQPTKSTRTGTPMVSENFLMLARKITSSGSTNLVGRSTRSVAPFSIGSGGMAVSTTGMAEAGRPASPAAASPPPRARALRRETPRLRTMLAIAVLLKGARLRSLCR